MADRFQFVGRGPIGKIEWFLLDRQELAEIGPFPIRAEAARYAADPEGYTEEPSPDSGVTVDTLIQVPTRKEPSKEDASFVIMYGTNKEYFRKNEKQLAYDRSEELNKQHISAAVWDV